jgi:hypothetical protein
MAEVGVEIGGIRASLEEISEAIAILTSQELSTAIRQPLQAQGNVLAQCDYHLAAEDFLTRHPDHVTPVGTKKKHAGRVKSAFLAFLTEQLVIGSLGTNIGSERQFAGTWKLGERTGSVSANQ